jgi:two-component system, NtrC family, sensor kinase
MTSKPLKILIIEDDEDDAFYIKDLLKEGLGKPAPIIDHHSSIGSRLKTLNPFQYDLAMFDYRLGEKNGIELLRSFREQGCDIPIILFTGQGDQEVAVEAMKAGATDYLTKGKLSTESVTQSIRYALGLRKEEALRKQTEEKLKKSHVDLTLAHRELQASMKKLKTAQNQILRSEKLAGIGRMVAGVCHEILNPLNIISGHSQSLLIDKSTDLELCQDLESIMEEIQRISKIISSLLKFSRKGNMEFKKADIRNELESVLSLIEKEMQLKGIETIRKFDPNNLPVYIDTDGIRQVFLNLINNAKFAMSGGGVLTVSTQVLAPETNWSSYQGKESTTPPPENIMRVKFSDTGSGIRKEDIEKIFEPFFTTKPEEKGTGLGLSVSYAIIEKHGGSLEVESELDVGTTIIIDLPIRE